LTHAEKRIIMAADGPLRRYARSIIITVACTSGLKNLKSYNYQNIHPN
jgi:capsule polysaccharide modification protein KpsS